MDYITIVHGEHYCKLFAIYNNEFYYSTDKSYRELKYFKQPSLIEFISEDLIIHSKNGKNILVLNKH